MKTTVVSILVNASVKYNETKCWRQKVTLRALKFCSKWVGALIFPECASYNEPMEICSIEGNRHKIKPKQPNGDYNNLPMEMFMKRPTLQEETNKNRGWFLKVGSWVYFCISVWHYTEHVTSKILDQFRSPQSGEWDKFYPKKLSKFDG